METLESAFDRSRSGPGVLRLLACIAAAGCLVLLGITLAPGNAARSAKTAAAPSVPSPLRDRASQSEPPPLQQPNPLSGNEEHQPPPMSSEWCVSPGEDHLDPAEASWETTRLVSDTTSYILRHPIGWQVVTEGGGVHLVSPPDADMVLLVVFEAALDLRRADIMNRGAEMLSEYLPQLDIERSEKATVAGVEGCRVIATEPTEAGQASAEYLWAVVGDDVVVAGLLADQSVPASEKELARRVLNSLAPAATGA